MRNYQKVISIQVETIILSRCNKKTIIVKMGAYFFALGALYQNKHSLTDAILCELFDFSLHGGSRVKCSHVVLCGPPRRNAYF